MIPIAKREKRLLKQLRLEIKRVASIDATLFDLLLGV
jgi:hypothetical protein